MTLFTLAVAALAALAPLVNGANVHAARRAHARRGAAPAALAARDCGSVGGPDLNMRNIVYRTAVGRGVTYSVLVTVFETVLTESNCNNLNCGDRQSHGLFQQQAPGFGWGTVAQTLDPVHATNAFLDCAIPNSQSQSWMSPDQLAQFCQQAQAGNRYAGNHDAAVAMIQAASDATGIAVPGSKVSAQSAPPKPKPKPKPKPSSTSTKPKPTTTTPTKKPAPTSSSSSAPSSSPSAAVNVAAAPKRCPNKRRSLLVDAASL